MQNITFDELWEILFSLEDKVEQIENNINLCQSLDGHESDIEIYTEKAKYLKNLICKVEYKLNNGEV